MRLGKGQEEPLPPGSTCGDLPGLTLPRSQHGPVPPLMRNPEGKAKVAFFYDLGCTVPFLKRMGSHSQLSGVAMKTRWG